MKLSQLVIIAGLCTLLSSQHAAADCRQLYAGPVGSHPMYVFSSSCFRSAGSQYLLRNQVCTLGPDALGFFWTKLNWVSGSRGVPSGRCLIKSDYYDRIVDLNGSEVKTTLGSSDVTDVHAPDLGPNNNVYTETLDGGGPLTEGGSLDPFHFEIRYSRRAPDTVEVHVAISGGMPVFYLLLPPIIKSADDLKKYMGGDYVDAIAKYIQFNSGSLRRYVPSDDKMLSEYLAENGLEKGRGIVGVPTEAGVAQISFDLHSSDITLRNLTDRGVACIGNGKAITSCF